MSNLSIKETSLKQEDLYKLILCEGPLIAFITKKLLPSPISSHNNGFNPFRFLIPKAPIIPTELDIIPKAFAILISILGCNE